jgi:carboxylesterase
VGVYGATFRYDGWSIPWAARLSFMLPLLKKLRLGRERVFLEQPPYGLRDERLRAQVSAAMHSGDSTIAGLLGNPWHALADLYQLARQVRRQLPQVTAPCLVAHASEDDVASVRNAELVMRNVSAPAKLLLLEDSYHMITIDKERRTLIEHSARFFDAIAAARSPQTAAA